MTKLSFFNKLLLFFNAITALATLAAIAGFYVPVHALPAFSILSLLIPLLILIHGGFLLYWLLARKLQVLLSTAVLALCYLALGPFYKISGSTEKEETCCGNLSVMSFNVRSFNKYEWIDDPNIESEILSLIQTKNPDILCFQEFSTPKTNLFQKFPYQYQSPAYKGKTLQRIFSKYPIINSGSLDFPDTFNNAIYVDIAFKNDTLKLYNVHLQSFNIIPEMNTFTKKDASQLFEQFSTVMLKQYEQANIIRKHMEKSAHKKIVTGDFNNTQYTNIYHLIKGDMKDSFFEKGEGFGRTYDLWQLPIRIDYILADPALQILSHENFNQKLSDHYPVMATLKVPSAQPE